MLIRDVGLASKVKHLLLSMLGSLSSREWDPVVDLSVGGACFRTNRDLCQDERLLLTLRIDSQVTPVQLEAVVVRVGQRDKRGRRRIGMMFTGYRDDALSVLKWFEDKYADWVREMKHKREEKRKERASKSREGRLSALAEDYLGQISVGRPGAIQGHEAEAQ